jgi:hypothetical protein
MPAISKDQLLRPRVSAVDPHDTYVTLPDGDRVFIRPLARSQSLAVHEAQQEHGLGHAEALLLSLGMVEPSLSVEEAAAWLETPGAAADCEAVSRGIGVISGMVPASGKEAYKSV